MALSEAALGAIISGAATVTGAGISGFASGRMNKRAEKFNREEAANQRAWNEKMTAQQNAWNMELWNKENEYNTPTAQMERLREAGLNPLYYGLDGNSTEGPQAAQALGYERATAPNYANPFEGFGDIAAKIAQISNIQADTAKKNNENLTETQRREKIQAEIENVKQENNNLKAQEGLTKSQKEQIDKNNSWLDRINEATVAEKESDAALKKSQKKRIDELLEGEKILQAKTAQDFDEKWKKIHAEIAKIAGENAILAKDLENYALNHASNGFMGTGLSLQNLFRAGKNIHPSRGEENKFSEGTDAMDLARSGQ